MRIYKSIAAISVAMAMTLPAYGSADKGTSGALLVPETQPDSVTTAVAVFMADVVQGSINNIEMMGVEVDRTLLSSMISDALQGKPLPMTRQQADSLLTNEFQRIQTSLAPKPADSEAEKRFLADAAARKGAVTTATGLVFETLEAGEGRKPTADNTVVVRYRGTLSDGTVFDEVEPDAEPLEFPVSDLTPGFTEGLQMMQPGGRYRLTMPDSLAYGRDGIPGVIPGGAALCFEVELIDVK